MTVQLRSTAAQATHAVQDRAKDTSHTLQDRAKGAGHTVQDKAKSAGHSLQDRARETGHGLQDTVARAGDTVEHRAPAPLRTPVRYARQHPRPVLIAVAAGATLAVAAMLTWRRTSR
jgi:ElaB/YqjD/DUF883 family membrane-anchored ribosome-binding protein